MNVVQDFIPQDNGSGCAENVIITTTDRTVPWDPNQITVPSPPLPGTIIPPQFSPNFGSFSQLQTLTVEAEILKERVTVLESDRENMRKELLMLRQKLEALEALAPQPFDRILKDITDKEQST